MTQPNPRIPPTAIDNTRIIQLHNDHVTFCYKDYRDHDRHKQMRLTAVEFIRRFLLHILPDGFMRIRHDGYLANSCRRKKLEQINPRPRTARQQAKHTHQACRPTQAPDAKQDSSISSAQSHANEDKATHEHINIAKEHY